MSLVLDAPNRLKCALMVEKSSASDYLKKSETDIDDIIITVIITVHTDIIISKMSSLRDW